MKAHFRANGLTIELEAANTKDLFKEVAKTQEIFGEDFCGNCKGENIRFQVREVDGNEFPELVCKTCGYKLAFGLSKQKKGEMFPIRKLTKEGKPSRKEGTYEFGAKTNGWTKWKGKETEEGEE